MKHVFDVDGAEFIASSVMRVRWTDRSRAVMNYGPQFGIDLDAEAAVADFGELGLVFVPLKAEKESGRYPIGIFLNELLGFMRLDPTQRSEAIRTIPNLRSEVLVPPDHWPMLVRFDDLSLPASADGLSPDDMFPSSGRRARLLRSTLQVTDDPPTIGILSVLPWISGLETSLSGTFGIRPRGRAADRLSQVHFKI